MDGPADGLRPLPYVERWEIDLAHAIAARYRALGPDDLKEMKAELSRHIFIVKEKAPAGVDWKPYLAQSLLNKAVDLLTQWSALKARHVPLSVEIETDVATSALDPPEDFGFTEAVVRKHATASENKMLDAVVKAKFNLTQAADLLGIHRNTLRNRLTRFHKRLEVLRKCPTPIVTTSEKPSDRLSFTTDILRDLRHMAKNETLTPSRRQRASIILLLASGHSHRSIARTLANGRPTVKRWAQRFADGGIAALYGRRPRPAHPALERVLNFLALTRGAPRHRMSCRGIALRLGVSKSTVQRALTKLRKRTLG